MIHVFSNTIPLGHDCRDGCIFAVESGYEKGGGGWQLTACLALAERWRALRHGLTQTSPVTLQQDMAGIHDKLQAVNEVTEHRKAQCFGAWVV